MSTTAADSYPQAARSTLRVVIVRIVGLARPHWKSLAVGIVLVLVGASVGLVIPLGIRELLDAVFERGDRALLDELAWILLALFVVQAGAKFYGRYLVASTGELVVARFRSRLFAHLLELDLEFFDDEKTGDLTSRLSNDVATLRRAATEDVATLLNRSLMLAGSVGLMLMLNWRLALLVMTAVPLVAVASRYFGRLIRSLSRSVQDELASVTAVAEEAIRGIRIVKAFGRWRYESERYDERVDHLFDAARERIWISSGFSALAQLVFMTTIAGIFWYGGTEVLAGRLTAGDLVAFFFYALAVNRGVQSLADLYARYSQAAGASERIFEILDREPAIGAPEAPTTRRRPRGEIRLDNVDFSYDGREKVLDSVDVRIAPGDTVALVGPNGAGKTTLLKTILRFFDPDAGRVLLDGHDLRDLDLESLRRHMALVQQEVQLFGTTVRDNIRYGNLEATDHEVVDAARAANAHRFVQALPRGYDTQVGERGQKLSGGQRQRIAIARAFLRKPAVLLLDEATSSVDSSSEALVQDALASRWERTTTLIVSHRLRTVRDADRIFVMENGRVVEQGDHQELISRDGLYADMESVKFGEAAVSS